MKKKIFTIIKLFLIVIIVFFTVGCEKTQKKEELNVLNWSSYIPDSVIHDFEDETGIKINYGTYSSNEECLAKVQSAKEGTYDIIFPSDYMVSLLIDRNMLQKLDKSQLSNISNLKKQYLNQEYDPYNEYSLPFLSATTVIAYNKENIIEPITSYNDLLNKKYKNNIVMLDDQRVVIGMALQALGYNVNETSAIALEKAKEWLLELKSNIKAFDSDSPKTFLISKEVDIGLMWNAEAAIAMQENSNINVVYAKEGASISIDNYVILKGAKNTENAHKFIDYLLREDVMKQIIESYPYNNVNEKTQSLLSLDYLNNPASNTPNTELENAQFIKNIGKSILNYDRLWAEIK